MEKPVSKRAIDRDKIFFFLVIFLAMLLTGCVHFITPKIGSIALEAARIPLPETGQTQGSLERQNLRIDYTLTTEEDQLDLQGTLTFDRSLTDSFRIMKRFFLKLNFIDGDGRVLMVTDITPNFSYRSDVQEKMALKFKGEIPAGSKGIVFSYFGTFRGDMPNMSGTWDISYSPFD